MTPYKQVALHGASDNNGDDPPSAGSRAGGLQASLVLPYILEVDLRYVQSTCSTGAPSFRSDLAALSSSAKLEPSTHQARDSLSTNTETYNSLHITDVINVACIGQCKVNVYFMAIL